jgi:hypothetical protein
MVIRLDSRNNLVNARPCYNCALLMKAVGINKVYYSVDNIIVSEKVSNLISINASKIVRISEQIQYRAPLNTSEYYTKIISRMPREIKQINLEYFIKYNLSIEFSEFNYVLNKDKTFNIINSTNKIIGILVII